VFSTAEAALMVACCKQMPVPLDDGLYALQATRPHLTRSARHRCRQRPGLNRVPEREGDKPAKNNYKPYPLGYVHIDIARDPHGSRQAPPLGLH
jgi:hypothetical protein